jgi:hypothetical protein
MVSALTAVTFPNSRANWILTLTAVVANVDDAEMSTWSPTTRAAAVADVESSEKVVVGLMANVVDVPLKLCTVTDVAVTAVTIPRVPEAQLLPESLALVVSLEVN